MPLIPKDISELTTLATQIWNAYYPAIITKEQIDYMLDKGYSAPALLNQMEAGQQFFFIEENHVRCGFIAVSDNKDGTAFIHKYYLNTNLHGKGVGSAAFQLLISNLPQIHTFRLQVNRQNIQAINFYFKQGFVIEKAADFDIGNGYFMNDFVMLKA